ncbi:DNA ligase [Galdieria sulphuraria]|uniref:DNA ligase n=1 Tax=Galdieria sulphuraria TaxID=130081 RepID=M2XE66_GALSU|nr:DNA ligase [Galdieria sulphuraria]EME28277.1 DNA ligase [Galdieria sulphuraria]|eukprot:XP_005704797.1 DNA ligase [Galdieria sulphuraria]
MNENWNHIPTSHQVPHTLFLVDYFLKLPTQVSAFFLTHWHYDHYRGLGSNFQQGFIYCSPITARLLERITLVDPQWIVAKHNNEPFLVDKVQIRFLDANHCPGSVMILFQTSEGSNYLHTGDMRFTQDLKKELIVLNNICLDAVYLDTTYCHRKYRFPSQAQTIQRIVHKIQNMNRIPFQDSNSNRIDCTSRHTLYLIATYSIGKERIIDALIQNGYRIYVSPDKWKVLRCLEFWNEDIFNEYFTTDPAASPIWLVGWNRVAESVPGRLLPNFEALEEMLYMANHCRNRQVFSHHHYSDSFHPNGLLQRVMALVPTDYLYMEYLIVNIAIMMNCTISLLG